MENVYAERSAGWSVLCYVAVVLVAMLLASPLPSPSLRAVDTALLIDSHRFGLALSAWLAFPASAFFLWFLVGLRSYLRYAPGRQEGLPTFALVAGVVMVASSLFAAALLTAAVSVPVDAFSSGRFVSIYDAFVFTQSGLGYAPAAIFLFAAAHSMRRHQSAPGWLALLGYVAAFGASIATLSVFFSDSMMAPGEQGPAFFGAVPTAIWLIATGLVLVQSKRGSPPSSTSDAS
jgi:hypothetical protein